MKGFNSILLSALLLFASSCASDTKKDTIKNTISHPEVYVIDGWYGYDSCWVTGTGTWDHRIQNPILRHLDGVENATKNARKLMLEFLIKTYFREAPDAYNKYDHETVEKAFIKAYSTLIENGQLTSEKQFDYDSYSVVFVINKTNLKKEIISGSAMK